MKYLQPNITNEEFVDRLKKSIESNMPLSFSRFGDGEIYFINGNVPAKVVDNYLRIMYKYTDIGIGKRDILGIIETAISETDVIGIMDKNNEISKRIPYSKSKWSIKSDYVNRLRNGKELIIADHMIARGQAMGDINNFKDVIRGKGVAIISPHAQLLKQNNIQKLLDAEVNFIETQMDMKFRDRKNMLLRFDEIKEPIVLYGCSFMGKDFSVHLRDRGKIALDFGSTLDAWAGLLTKRWFKKGGLQDYCLIENANGS